MPVVSNSTMRPVPATPAVMSPTAMRKVRVTPFATSVRYPLLSEPRQYELPAVVIDTPDCTPATELRSITPELIPPVPLATMEAMSDTGPLASNPARGMRYRPLRRLSLPPAQVVMEVTSRVSCCVAVAGVGMLESVSSTVKVLVPVVLDLPVIAPVAVFRESPPGSEPVWMLQVKGKTAEVSLYWRV